MDSYIKALEDKLDSGEISAASLQNVLYGIRKDCAWLLDRCEAINQSERIEKMHKRRKQFDADGRIDVFFQIKDAWNHSKTTQQLREQIACTKAFEQGRIDKEKLAVLQLHYEPQISFSEYIGKLKELVI